MSHQEEEAAKKRVGTHVSAYVDDDVKRKAEAAAAQDFLSLSAWFRKLIYRELGLKP
jgi:hypothetical protein